jgi:chemotaxis methyl-accepting protein methylase
MIELGLWAVQVERGYSVASRSWPRIIAALSASSSLATDLYDAALKKARAGFYPKGALQDVSSSGCEDFRRKVDGYRVQKALRDMHLRPAKLHG